MDIIVCDEKHGTTYWDATTEEAWASSSLAILTERWNQGYWYHDPESDGLGNSAWADQRREEYRQALALTPEEIEALPETARQNVFALRNEATRETEHDRRHRAWYARAKDVVESQNLSMVTVGRNRFAREVPAAWQLLEERSDHEYEHVTIETLQRVPTKLEA